MWYVVQVFTGEEEKIKEICQCKLSEDILNECFIPYYEEMKKYKGEWHKEQKILFPGYIFIGTRQIDVLYMELKKIQVFTKVLGDKTYMLPLSDGETAFLKSFGGKDQIVKMSKGIIQNDQVKIIDGPLKGWEGCIRKINRHKRWAEIEVEMFGKIVSARVGLEVIRKC